MIGLAKVKEFVSFAALFLFVVACLLIGFELHNAYGYEGMKIDVEVVAGIDTHKVAKLMEKEAKKAEKQKLKECEQADIELMAHLVFAENGDDSYSEYKKAMMYTGSVVLNRVASDKFPGTIEDVIYQKGQYACTWDGGISKKPSKEAYEVASKLLRSGSKLPSKVLYAAEFKQGNVYDYAAGTYYCY